MEKIYIGIDPGSKGFVAVDYGDGNHEFCAIADNDYHDIALFLSNVKALHEGRVVCCMEEIHAVYGSSAKATFSFGEVFGVLQGILVALGIGYHLVPPKTWQKEIWVNKDKVYKSKVGGNGKHSRLTTSPRASTLPGGFSLALISAGLRSAAGWMTTSVTLCLSANMEEGKIFSLVV